MFSLLVGEGQEALAVRRRALSAQTLKARDADCSGI